ncbi:YgjV family protein [Photobacterium toruni]|uniref:Bacterial inner membrane protein n=1 Tax=Photobacterium toruni TaxID=1935446 RepID=A0A1T4QF36_9GAMM|nr:YgjV family protein [Photobacterium toruni]SKA02256.1 Bacterial inner membrane protein [Photobacterium toruni]
MSLFVASQILVGLAALFDIASFQFKNRTVLLSALCISALLIAAHFMLLDEWTAACLLIIGSCRYLAGIFISNPKIKWLFYLVTLLGTVITFSGLTSILSCTASLLHTKASFSSNDKLMRWLMVIGTVVWGVHDVIVGSPVAVLIDVLFVISSIIGYYRIYIKSPCLLKV